MFLPRVHGVISWVVLTSLGCVPREADLEGKRTQSTQSASKADDDVARDESDEARDRAKPIGVDSDRLAHAKALASKAAVAKDPLIEKPFSDDFQRAELGDDWRLTSPRWRIDGGQLCVSNARNHPAWLARRLPENARIEFDVTTASADGDIKAELWGDGRSAATKSSYTNASSYITIWGGWKNRFHVLARIDEHAKDRLELKIEPDGSDPKRAPVVPNRAYHFKVERRDGTTLRWFVDDIEIFSFADPKPLKGPGHDHFGFNDWQVRLCFDNLKIVPLPS